MHVIPAHGRLGQGDGCGLEANGIYIVPQLHTSLKKIIINFIVLVLF